jgi:hypothetical protein
MGESLRGKESESARRRGRGALVAEQAETALLDSRGTKLGPHPRTGPAAVRIPGGFFFFEENESPV